MDKEMNWDSALERHEDRVNNEVKKQNKTDIVMCHENQEPVGEVVMESMGVGDAQIVRFRMNGRIPPVGTKLYAAPVRTKDLTDEEIAEIVTELDSKLIMRDATELEIARAVIAKFKEKNNVK